ncbi:MAG: TonB C-terminal domain-containing protein, partial [Lentisphaeria bacterium]|nr:TonB C-terminal domain-containing protein [Lentisphaeria bacterium]
DDPKPTVTPPKPKDDPMPTVKPPPKTEQKKDPPKSNLLKPEDIIKPKNTKTQAQINAERKAREAAEARAKAEAEARQRAIADIRAAAGTQQGRYGTTNPGQEGILATKEMRDYYETLNAYIRPKWSAVSPSNIELGGKISNWPAIDLTISKKGEITNAVFVSQSGNKKIDDAVKQLLANLKVVPAPPQAATIRVTLDIR